MHQIVLQPGPEGAPLRFVVVDAGGVAVEEIGSWPAETAPDAATLDEARLKHWIAQGAQPSAEVRPAIAEYRRAQLEAMRKAYEQEVQIQHNGAADEFTEI